MLYFKDLLTFKAAILESQPTSNEINYDSSVYKKIYKFKALQM